MIDLHSFKMIDLHSHILPGLDDGSRSLQESLEIARIAEKDGIKKMVATPHLFRGEFDHQDLGIIQRKRDELSQALERNNISVEIFRGAEIHVSHNLIQQISQNRQYLTLNESSYVFVEFPSDHVFPEVKSLFFELMSEGIIPIITHPERNSVFVSTPSLLYELIQMGVLSQANSGSFSGLYGKTAREAVHHFLDLNLIHFIASDCHNTRSFVPRLSEAVERAVTIIGEEKARALVRDNPQAVLDDEEIPYLDDPINPKEKEKPFNINISSIFRGRK
jgi:protein-tyrosine phosphatase